MTQQFDDDVLFRASDAGLADDENPFADDPVLLEVDRSAAEAYSTCPAMARFIEDGRVLNITHAMEVGTAVHDALSDTVAEYIELVSDIQGRVFPSMLVDAAMRRLVASRPDVQQDAVQAAQRALWTWANMLFGINTENILRFDGGTGRRSGQLGYDIPQLGICFTSEVDFLYQSESPTLLREVDYKSGHKYHTETAIKKSFQFGCAHPVLVFHNFPTVQALDIQVLNMRANELTEPVRFERRYLPEYEGRLMAALKERAKWIGVPPEKCAVWPTIEKCPTCPARAMCPGIPPCDVEANPVQFVQHLATLQAVLDARYEQATAYVDRIKADIECPDGTRFGRRKPPAKPRSQPAVLYTLSTKEGDK